jgi:hypothetical protein
MRRTVDWSSMTRILGELRTSGKLTGRRQAEHSIAGCARPIRLPGGAVWEYYIQSDLLVIVMQITLGLRELPSLGSTLPAILEQGAALIVLGAG